MRIVRTYVLVAALIVSASLQAQELYPYAEPASTLPKRMVGIRQTNEAFTDAGRARFFSAFRLMYGLHQYCTVGITAGISNHHQRRVPKNYIFYLLNHHARSYPDNPVLFEGAHVYTKIRLFSKDGSKQHWRIAAMLEGSLAQTAHAEAEPNLTTDNTGYGISVIGTRLYRRWAINLQAGTIRTKPYEQEATKDDAEFYIRFSDAYQATLSNGFRIYPAVLKDYKQTNVNLYVELHYKQYKAAVVEVNGQTMNYDIYKPYSQLIYGSMSDNKYVDVRTYLQLILDSQNRVEVGVTFAGYNRSYLHNYPLWTFQVQRFFFGK